MGTYAENLETVMRLAQELQGVQQNIAIAQDDVRSMQEREKEIAESRLPELLDELGYTELKLSNGRRLEMGSKVFASIPTEAGISRMKSALDQSIAQRRRDAALAWLRANGLGDLIKNEVSVNFSRGLEQEAQELAAELNVRGLQAGLDSTVNTQTLSAQVKELLANGEDVPFETLGITVVRTVKVK